MFSSGGVSAGNNIGINTSFTETGNCSVPILKLETYIISLCLITNQVRIKICNVNFYGRRCFLLDDVDYQIFCTRIKPYLPVARSVLDKKTEN